MSDKIISDSWELAIDDSLEAFAKIPLQLGGRRDPVDQWYFEYYADMCIRLMEQGATLDCDDELDAPIVVYVLTSAFDMEGETVLGVYESLADAKSKAESLASERGEYEWADNGEWRLSCGASHYIIRPEPIQ